MKKTKDDGSLFTSAYQLLTKAKISNLHRLVANFGVEIYLEFSYNNKFFF